MTFQAQYQAKQQRFEQQLADSLPEVPPALGGLATEAARYSLLAGGKRLRPVLMLSVAELFGTPAETVMPAAVALEMIHTYSLIHDDLPAMDDDVLRRGHPTCHVRYGEAVAILAGDLLLTRAFEILLAAAEAQGPAMMRAGLELARAAGQHGMIGGQVLDLAGEGQQLSESELALLQQLKTGALIRAACLAGCALSQAPPAACGILGRFADHLGLAFQIRDDLLDLIAKERDLGKSTGKDARDQKATFVTLLGEERATQRLQEETAAALGELSQLAAENLDVSFLSALSRYLLERMS